MSRINFPLGFIFPPGFILSPYHFAPPGNCQLIYTIFLCPISFFPLDSFCPPPPSYIILPPGNCLMIYTIYPCPISFPHPWIHFAPISFYPHIILPPYNFTPWKLFNDLPMSPIIFPPGFILPLVSFCPHGKKLFNDLHMSRIILPPGYILAPFTKKKAYDRRASGDCGTSGLCRLEA